MYRFLAPIDKYNEKNINRISGGKFNLSGISMVEIDYLVEKAIKRIDPYGRLLSRGIIETQIISSKVQYKCIVNNIKISFVLFANAAIILEIDYSTSKDKDLIEYIFQTMLQVYKQDIDPAFGEIPETEVTYTRFYPNSSMFLDKKHIEILTDALCLEKDPNLNGGFKQKEVQECAYFFISEVFKSLNLRKKMKSYFTIDEFMVNLKPEVTKLLGPENTYKLEILLELILGNPYIYTNIIFPGYKTGHIDAINLILLYMESISKSILLNISKLISVKGA